MCWNTYYFGVDYTSVELGYVDCHMNGISLPLLVLDYAYSMREFFVFD